MTDKPVLWQIEISHYSEKARWALDFKGVEHVRRAPLPGMHMPVALWLTRGEGFTFPVMQIDGRALGDSTEIIAALEQRHPEPPLYPADPEQRRRALELEDFFDEELGPHARLLAFHELIGEPEIFAELAAEAVPGRLGQAKGLTGLYARTYTGLRFGARDGNAAAEARRKIVAALERIEAELDASDGEHLVGDRFSVADLTAAALFYPVARPEGGPVPPDRPSPPAFEEFRAGLADRPGFRWLHDTYRRHRFHSPDAAPAAVG